MPGILGIISQKPAEHCQQAVEAMVASMQHERFYVSGTYFVSELGIYAGWIANDKSFAASQSFLNEERDVILIVSGECFLDSQIGVELRGRGHRLGTHKASWLVHLYEEKGNQFFEGLNGLFSGLLIDKRQRKAFLFNDRYGVERIYWHETEDGFYFASEAKALLRVLPELRAFDEEGLAQYLAFGCTLEERTLFRGVNVLPGASLWSFDNGKCHNRRYFSPETWGRQPALSPEAFQAGFQGTFRRILPRYFESESRIGISLTGGLDSRMIMACLPPTEEEPLCYTFSGGKRDTLDASLSAQIAKTCGSEHHILRIDPGFFSNFATHADRTVYFTDGCLGILGAHEIYLNEKARRLATVRLTGVFGGEILRGVSMFKPLGLSPGLVDSEMAVSVRSSVGRLARSGEHPITLAAFREIPWKRFGTPSAGRSQLKLRTPYLDNEIVALAYQAPASLRTSSLPAFRLIRENNPALAKIWTDMGELGKGRSWTTASRRIFSKATFKLDYLHNEGLPHWLSPFDALFGYLNSGVGILGLHKFLHYRSWFRRELAGYINSVLTDAQTRRSQFWNSDFVQIMAGDHIGGRKNYINEINAVLTLEAVERLLFHDLSRGFRSPDATAATSFSPASTS